MFRNSLWKGKYLFLLLAKLLIIFLEEFTLFISLLTAQILTQLRKLSQQ